MLETSAGNGSSVTNMVSGTAWTEGAKPAPASSINGRLALLPNGVDTPLISSEAAVVAAFTGVNPQLTLTMVRQNTVMFPTANAAMFGAGNSAFANTRTFRFFRNTTGRDIAQWIDDPGLTASPALPRSPVLTPEVITMCIGQTPLPTWLINQTVISATPTFSAGQVTPNQVALFCRPDSVPDTFGVDKWGCLIIWNRILPLADIRAVHAALMGRWGITNW